jgi:hypothetical protein
VVHETFFSFPLFVIFSTGIEHDDDDDDDVVVVVVFQGLLITT